MDQDPGSADQPAAGDGAVPLAAAPPRDHTVGHDGASLGDAASRALEARGLVREYGKVRVVNDVSLKVEPGEVVGLLGPNGAGKTTTFYMITGLLPPTAGTIFLNGRDITRLPMFRRARRGLGYLSQEPSIFRRLTVRENVMAILETIPLSHEQRVRRCEQLLSDLDILHLRDRKGMHLSGGERRRTEISRALVTEPSFILLDEPFVGIDPIAVAEIQQIIVSLKNRGLGVLITDHSVRETLGAIDRAYLMFEGRILLAGTAQELAADPQARKLYLGENFRL
jgi:lipopolysaccharide export system ATP-binding protein